MRATIEVDTFNVVNGPGTTKLLEVILELQRDSDSRGTYIGSGVRTTFTVTTAASQTPVKATVAIYALTRQTTDRPPQVYFSGRYGNVLVDGVYDYQLHQGSFSEM